MSVVAAVDDPVTRRARDDSPDVVCPDDNRADARRARVTVVRPVPGEVVACIAHAQRLSHVPAAPRPRSSIAEALRVAHATCDVVRTTCCARRAMRAPAGKMIAMMLEAMMMRAGSAVRARWRLRRHECCYCCRYRHDRAPREHRFPSVLRVTLVRASFAATTRAGLGGQTAGRATILVAGRRRPGSLRLRAAWSLAT